jgi:hypothetical protein
VWIFISSNANLQNSGLLNLFTTSRDVSLMQVIMSLEELTIRNGEFPVSPLYFWVNLGQHM